MDFKKAYVAAIITMGKNIGAGLATIRLAGAGIDVGLSFVSYIFAIFRNAMVEQRKFKYIMLALTIAFIGIGLTFTKIDYLILYLVVYFCKGFFFLYGIKYFFIFFEKYLFLFINKFNKDQIDKWLEFFFIKKKLQPFIKIFFYYLALVHFLRATWGFEEKEKKIVFFFPLILCLTLTIIFFFKLISSINLIFILFYIGFQILNTEFIGIVSSSFLKENPKALFSVNYKSFLDKKQNYSFSGTRFIWFRAGIGAAYIGKSGLSSSGKAVVTAGAMTAFSVLLDGELNRRHQSSEAVKARNFEEYKMQYYTWEKNAFNGDTPPRRPKE